MSCDNLREQTLDEFLGRLPPGHRARYELIELREELQDLREGSDVQLMAAEGRIAELEQRLAEIERSDSPRRVSSRSWRRVRGGASGRAWPWNPSGRWPRPWTPPSVPDL